MSQKFQAAVNQREDVSYVKLAGVIDEDNQLGELVDQIPSGTAVIDLGEIERINSCGVRDWVNWLSRLEGQRTKVVLVECSPAIVAQINLVNNFTGSGVVKSFYVPYFCPECDEEKVLLVEATDMGPAPHEPPTCRCDECDLVMDFDDMPDSYFAFLGNSRRMAEPDKVHSAMRSLAPNKAGGDDGKGKIRSRVSSPAITGGAKSASLPSVPSLPSISRSTGSAPGGPPLGRATGSNPGGAGKGSPSRPGYPGHPGNPGMSSPHMMAAGAGSMADRAPVTQPRGSAMIYALVGVLVVLIAVLGYLVVTK
ncbi:MAG: hypothetical protein KA297_04765 [Kofleriaceae bacterium]|nr:hypothetical protein [Kofleriaceae bacterium]MBP6835875.1 hypothetical protein [Kofleriaceae bacterium]